MSQLDLFQAPTTRFIFSRSRLGAVHIVDTHHHWVTQETLCEHSTRWHRVAGDVTPKNLIEATCVACVTQIRRVVTEWVATPKGDTMERDAEISDDGVYRYRLDRWWDDGDRLSFVMLNPSKADAQLDDPTVRACCALARREGYAGITIANLFAWRATDPGDLAGIAGDIVGVPRNLAVLDEVIAAAATVVAAWGARAADVVRRRRLAQVAWSGAVDDEAGLPEMVVHLAMQHGTKLVCLGTTKDGHPKHPVRLGSKTPLVPWSPQ